MEVPVLDGQGNVVTDATTKKPEFVKEYAVNTCYHIAHREVWKGCFHQKNVSTIKQVDKAEEAAKKKKTEEEAAKQKRIKKKKNKGREQKRQRGRRR